MECWHSVLRCSSSSFRCCVPTYPEDEQRNASPSSSPAAPREPLQKRAKLIPSSCHRPRGAAPNRWSHHVSTWLQRLRGRAPPRPPFCGEGAQSALKYDLQTPAGSKTPVRYFNSDVVEWDAAEGVKNDLFLLVLCRRKALLLPKFYPRSLHCIHEDSSADDSKRRDSDPTVFSLDSSYDLKTSCDRKPFPGFVDYPFSSNPTHSSSSYSKLKGFRELVKDADSETSFYSSKSVKQRIQEKLIGFLKTSKSTTQADESTCFPLKYSQNTFQESTPKPPSYFSTSSVPFLVGSRQSTSFSQSLLKKKPGETSVRRLRTESYPTKPTKLDSKSCQARERIRHGHCSQTSLHKECSSEDSIDYYKFSNERFSDEVLNEDKVEHERLVDSYDIQLKACSESTVTENKNLVLSTWKSFQDNFDNLTCKLRKKYSNPKTESLLNKERNEFSPAIDCSTVKSKLEIDSNSSTEKKHLLTLIPASRKSTDSTAINASAELLVRDSVSSRAGHESLSLFKIRKMSRRKSNYVGNNDECSEEPPEKYSRSMSLPPPENQCKDSFHPVRPQRRRFLHSYSSFPSEPSGEDETAVSTSDKAVEFDSRKDLRDKKKMFLSKMVSICSDEEEGSSISEGVRAHTENVDILNESSSSTNSETCVKNIIDIVLVNPENGNESNSASEVEAPAKELPTAKNESDREFISAPIDVSSYEITEIDCNANTCVDIENRTIDLKLKTNCDNLPSVIESLLQEEKLPERSTFNMHVNTDSECYAGVKTCDIHQETVETTDKPLGTITECESPAQEVENTAVSIEAKSEKTGQGAESSGVCRQTETIYEHEEEKYTRHFRLKENDKSDTNSEVGPICLSKSSSQPQIFITPAEGSNDVLLEKTKPKTEIISFVESIHHSYRSEWSLPPSGILATSNSVDSQPESSSIFTELEGLSPSVGDTFTVSPNLSPRGQSPVAGGATDHRPTPPKSPITVQEWIDSLPPTTDSEREEVWGEFDQPQICNEKEIEKKPIEVTESLNLGDEACALAATTPANKTEIPESETPSSRSSQSVTPASQILTRYAPPLTLKDIQRSVSKEDSEAESFAESGLPEGLSFCVAQLAEGIIPSKRTLFAETREKQTSFQSETSVLSGVSHQTVSSIGSLLESRQVDPVDILLNLGFGSTEEDERAPRIPPRFMKPSKVPGNDINLFLKQEDNISDMVESEWVMPNAISQAFRRSSVNTVSPLVSNLMERVRDGQGLLQRTTTRSDISSTSSRDSPKPLPRFASVARGLSKQASFARRLSCRAQRRDSVLMPENRKFLDLQGLRSPEPPKRRLILGTDSFSLDNQGEIIDSDEEEKKKEKEEEEEEEEEEEKNGEEEAEEEGDVFPAAEVPVHRDSFSSVFSSGTSIDSKEEARCDELHQLALSVGLGPAPNKPSTPDKKKNLFMRLSNPSKRKALVSLSSTSSSWELESQITEEDTHPYQSNSTLEETDSVDEETPREKRRSIVRQQHVEESSSQGSLERGSSQEDEDRRSPYECVESKELKGGEFAQRCSTRHVLTKADKSNHNSKTMWSVESSRSQETVKHFPLKRSLVLSFPFATARRSEGGDHDLDPVTEVDLEESLKRRRTSRRSSSLPDIHAIEEDILGPPPPPSPPLPPPPPSLSGKDLPRPGGLPPQQALLFEGQESEEALAATLDSLQSSMNATMLAVLQTCKTQADLQSRLCRRASEKTFPTQRLQKDTRSALGRQQSDDLLYSETRSPEEHFDRIPGELSGKETGESPRESPIRSPLEESESQMSQETSEVASRMRSSINSVLSQLEHYLTDVCPKFSSSPDISSTVGQMLWLLQHQSQLCSDLERLSSAGSAHPSRSPTPQAPPGAWAPSHPFFYRSMPDQLNARFASSSSWASNPPSIHSASPYMNPSFPSLTSPFPLHSCPRPPPFNLGASPLLNHNSPSLLSEQKGGKTPYSYSESSCDGSVELGGGDSGALGEWNDGKTSGVSSPANNWTRNPRSPDSVYGDLFVQKIKQELEENLGSKVSQMNGHMNVLTEKIDKYSEDVSDIREKLTLFLQGLSGDLKR